jgi:hypothetical protein
VDEEKPIFLKQADSDEFQTTVTFGDTILVIQNQQTSVRGNTKCGDRFVYDNLRNPLGAALRSIGTALLGMSVPVIDDPFTSSRAKRIVATSGGSPHFGTLSGATPLFNRFDIVPSLLLTL